MDRRHARTPHVHPSHGTTHRFSMIKEQTVDHLTRKLYMEVHSIYDWVIFYLCSCKAKVQVMLNWKFLLALHIYLRSASQLKQVLASTFTVYHLHLRDDSKTLHIQRLERNSKQHHQLGVSNPHCYSSKRKPPIYATVTCLISRWHQWASISASCLSFFHGLIASCSFFPWSHCILLVFCTISSSFMYFSCTAAVVTTC
jgi:hypothetical protein